MGGCKPSDAPSHCRRRLRDPQSGRYNNAVFNGTLEAGATELAEGALTTFPELTFATGRASAFHSGSRAASPGHRLAIELPKTLLSDGLAPVSTRRIVALMPSSRIVSRVMATTCVAAAARLAQPPATRTAPASQAAFLARPPGHRAGAPARRIEADSVRGARVFEHVAQTLACEIAGTSAASALLHESGIE